MKNILYLLKALSDETRLRIVNLLYERELCVCDIVETLQITQTKASRHLTYMKNAGLVSDRKSAQWVYYSIQKDSNTKLIDSLVYENLRNLEQFNSDLASLEDWLKRKTATCS